jgi:hypothetical protein
LELAMRARYILPALALLAALVSPAHAAVIDPPLPFDSAEWDLSSSSASHWSTGQSLTPGVTNSTAYDAHAWDHMGVTTVSSDTLYINGWTNVDPVLFISQTVTNNTAFPWSGYTLDCSASPGSASFILPGSTTGAPFTQNSFSSTHIDFGAPGGPVLPTQSVTLNYFIDISSIGSFSLTIVQGPVLLPEPASMGILAVGALALLRRRR